MLPKMQENDNLLNRLRKVFCGLVQSKPAEQGSKNIDTQSRVDDATLAKIDLKFGHLSEQGRSTSGPQRIG